MTPTALKGMQVRVVKPSDPPKKRVEGEAWIKWWIKELMPEGSVGEKQRPVLALLSPSKHIDGIIKMLGSGTGVTPIFTRELLTKSL